MSYPVHRPIRAAAGLAAALGLLLAPGVVPAQQVVVPAQAPGAQEGRITGVVTGEGGVPVAGSQVVVVGTRFGAVTSAEGRYTIVGVPAGTHQVRAQRIGYSPVTQQVTVTAGQAATADFRLAAVATNLETQVVVGYTTQQRRDVSDATASVRQEQLQNQQVATLEEALRGQAAGVDIAATGEPGRPAQVIIRGQTFLNAASPLYVVDGMYMGQNPNLNPDDIESVEVLKDASAAAQYGAQAANGVIVIRTRRGRQGDNRIEVRSYYGMQDVPKRIDMADATEWARIVTQAYENAGQPVIEGARNPQFDTDWQDAVFRAGAIQDHNISVSGGTPTASYLISGGFLRQQGSIIETGFERYSVRVNSELRRGRITFGENIALSSSERQFLDGFPLIDVVRLAPTIPIRNTSNPGGYGYGSEAVPTFGTNPVGALELRDNGSRSNQVIGSLYGEAALFAGVRYRLNLGLNYEDYGREDFIRTGITRFRGPTEPARLTNYDANNTSLLFENLLTYDGDFGGGRHRVSAVGGITEQRQVYNELQAYRESFTNEGLQTIDAGGQSNLNNRGFQTEAALRALLLRTSYTLADRYILTGSVRRDGSSRFGSGNKYGTFGAVSAGWVLSEEGFFRALPLVGRAGFVKLRASYGVLGNQDIGDYRFDALVNQNINYLFGNSTVASGATQLSLSNPNIRWQEDRQADIGLDLGLMNERVTVTMDYYSRLSDGVLVDAPIPPSLGAVGSPTVNAGSIKSAGFEFAVTHRHETSALELNTSLNFTTNRNHVVTLGNGGQPIFAGFSDVAQTAVGGAIGDLYVKRTLGIFQSEAEVQSHTSVVDGQTVVIQPDAEPGDIRFDDINGDGRIGPEDRYVAGNPNPDFTAGFFMDGRFRSFDFALNLRGSRGGEVFNVVRYWTDRLDDVSNFRSGLNPWTPTNKNTSTPRAVIGEQGAANADPVSDRWIEDASFLRVQNVMLGYRLPVGLSQRLGMRGATAPRVYVNLQNLYTFTGFSNWDPETLGAGLLARGFDDGAIYPNVRTISFGIDLSF